MLLFLLLAAPGCTGSGQSPVTSIDLVSLFDSADKRPAHAIFTVRKTTFDGGTLSGIVAVVPSRITFPVRMPRKAMLRAAFGIEPAAWNSLRDGVVLRFGISDRRTYETLLSQRLEAPRSNHDRAWRRINVDLSAYSGWQWSLFYRPSVIPWEIVFSIEGSPVSGVDRVEAVWGAPTIEFAR